MVAVPFPAMESLCPLDLISEAYSTWSQLLSRRPVWTIWFVFAVFLCVGQSGAATSGDTGEAQENKVYHSPKSYREGYRVPGRVTGKESGFGEVAEDINEGKT